MGKRVKNDMGNDTLRLAIMLQAMECGVTPAEYAEFYKIVNGDTDHTSELRRHDLSPANYGSPEAPERKRRAVGSSELKDAKEKTLTLRVQMHDVTKPPMWRELKVPADFTFLQLHKAIQAACGLEECHLWQFQRKPYDPELQIGVPVDRKDPYGMGLEDYTHDARKTGITAFLAEKGQKLVYVYDFGDDWIFNVSVVGIGPRDGDTALCTRWKSDLQPIEDTGGIWSYIDLRQAWSERAKLTKRQKEELADRFGYDSFDDLMDLVTEAMFDPETVNERLADI